MRETKKKSKEQINAYLQMLMDTTAEPTQKDEFNIFYVNTPRGRVKIKSNLSLEEFKNQFKK